MRFNPPLISAIEGDTRLFPADFVFLNSGVAQLYQSYLIHLSDEEIEDFKNYYNKPYSVVFIHPGFSPVKVYLAEPGTECDLTNEQK